MDLQLTGKKALVTGSTAGIGFAIADHLLQERAEVIINGRTTERVKQTISLLQQKHPQGNITGVAADFSKSNEVTSLLNQVSQVDILINNVGILNRSHSQKLQTKTGFVFTK